MGSKCIQNFVLYGEIGLCVVVLLYFTFSCFQDAWTTPCTKQNKLKINKLNPCCCLHIPSTMHPYTPITLFHLKDTRQWRRTSWSDRTRRATTSYRPTSRARMPKNLLKPSQNWGKLFIIVSLYWLNLIFIYTMNIDWIYMIQYKYLTKLTVSLVSLVPYSIYLLLHFLTERSSSTWRRDPTLDPGPGRIWSRSTSTWHTDTIIYICLFVFVCMSLSSCLTC